LNFGEVVHKRFIIVSQRTECKKNEKKILTTHNNSDSKYFGCDACMTIL